jgi:hypothetical protein
MDGGTNSINNALCQSTASQRHRLVRNMFGFFKRSAPAKPASTRHEPTKRRATGERPGYDPLEPLPKPEVTEGNEDSDWSLWENSMAFQDSQMPEPYPQTTPMPIQAADAGDSVLSSGFDTVRPSDL